MCVAFTNNGSLSLTNSTLTLSGGGTSTGMISVDASSALTFNSDYTIVSGAVTGAGQIIVQGGTATTDAGQILIQGNIVAIESSAQYNVTGMTSINGGTLQLNANAALGSLSESGGLLTGAGTVTVTGTMLLPGGAMTGTGRTIAQGGITIEGSGIGLDDGRVLENQGDTEWLGGVIDLNPFDDGNPAAGTFVNDVGATFNQRFNGGRILATNFGDADNGASALFNNLGSYYKGATGVPVNPTTVIAAAFNNAGELRVNDNVVQFTGPFSDAGDLSIAAGASVSVSGDLALQPTSELDIEVGPSGNGLLNVGGNLTLNGTLNVIQLAGFAPAVGQSFTFLTFASDTGSFATVEGTTIGNGEALSLDTSDTNDLRLDVVSTAPAVSSASGVLKTQASARPTATASKVAVG
jgi:fibronectin-binding autotransporter adhesin